MKRKQTDISKRKYIAPSIWTEWVEPWEMIAQTGGDVNGSTSTSDGNNDDPFGGSAKFNPFFTPDSNGDIEEQY